MSAQQPWPYQVPFIELVDPLCTIAAGEDSEERKTMAERAYHLPPVSYPTPSHVPSTAFEPPHPEPDPDYR